VQRTAAGECDWDGAFLNLAEGKPLKNVTVHANGNTVVGEVMVTRYGLEGGPIYALGRTLRSMATPVVRIDFETQPTRRISS
jgi:predicted flavoprotein YhiN